jgi:hypothetical protein
LLIIDVDEHLPIQAESFADLLAADVDTMLVACSCEQVLHISLIIIYYAMESSETVIF